MSKPTPTPRTAYRHFLPITTRWMDNDVYGHVNNVVYYSYFDTVVNEYLIRTGDAQAAAQGHFVHVYVDRTTRRPVTLPDALQAAPAPLLVSATSRAPAAK